MELTAPSRVEEEVRGTGTEAWLCHQVARRFWAPHTASLGVCLHIYSIRTLAYKDDLYNDDDLVKHPIDFYPRGWQVVGMVMIVLLIWLLALPTEDFPRTTRKGTLRMHLEDVTQIHLRGLHLTRLHVPDFESWPKLCS